MVNLLRYEHNSGAMYLGERFAANGLMSALV